MLQEILIVEDDQVLNRLLCKHIDDMGHHATGVYGWREADAYLEAREPHLIVTDARLPDGNSLERMGSLAEDRPVIVLTAYGSVRDAVDAIKAGAFEYLVKPVSPEELVLVVQRALDNAALRNDHQFCVRRLRAKENAFSYMIGDSEALDEVRALIDAVAPSDMTVLVQGESGSGKELVARAIHDSSDRADRNFVAVDCCTLQEKLFESELFGHERGAFTGADRLKKGLIEGAEGGTLFLDEIGEIEVPIQAKLLRTLETGKFRRVGGTRDLVANVRVVAATNRDLERLSQEGRFRPDLYFRLNAFTITSPPLRERRDDVPHLVEYFLRNHDFSRRINKRISAEALRRLIAYDWPGNIRELKNVVERAIILSRDKKKIRGEHLAFNCKPSTRDALVSISFDHDPTLEELEACYLKMQLKKYSGRRAQVAEVLNISERSVYRLIKRFDLIEKV